MVRRLPIWRGLASALLFSATAALPALAQEQMASANKFKVLVPNVEKRGTGKDIGKDVAEELRKLIVRMPRHEPIEKKEISDAYRKYQLKENEMDCIRNRQLGVQLNAELVMCGMHVQNGTSFTFDSIQFISTKTQEAFQLQPITAANAKEAAAQIHAQFERYINTIERLGFCYQYLESQSWTNAIENCEAALQVNPNSPRANMGKAFALMQMAGTGAQTDSAKLRESLALYRKVLELNPIEQEALRTAGILAARLALQDESRNYFKQYLELNPGDAGVRLTIAAEQARAGDAEGALRVVEEGLKADSASVDLVYWAGVFAAQAGFKAFEAARKAGATGSEVPPAAKPLFETAVTYYTRLLNLKNGDVDAGVANGAIQLLVLLGRAPEAIEFGRKALAANAKSGQVWAAYAGALANANRTPEALAAFDSAIARKDTAAVGIIRTKATVQLGAGDLEGAKATFRHAITANESKADEVADAIINAALGEHWPKKNYDAVLTYMDVALEFAEESLIKSKAHLWKGLVYYTRAAAGGTPQNAAQARNMLPGYQRALNELELGAEYGRSNPQVNYAQTIDGVRKYIAYLQEVIKRG